MEEIHRKMVLTLQGYLQGLLKRLTIVSEDYTEMERKDRARVEGVGEVLFEISWNADDGKLVVIATPDDANWITMQVERQINVLSVKPESRWQRWFGWLASRQMVELVDTITVHEGGVELESGIQTTRYLQYRLLGLTAYDRLLDPSEVPPSLN